MHEADFIGPSLLPETLAFCWISRVSAAEACTSGKVQNSRLYGQGWVVVLGLSPTLQGFLNISAPGERKVRVT